MNTKAMFDFAIEQKEEWKKTNDDVYRIAWETARAMIEVSGLWNEWKEYITNRNNNILKG